MTAGSLVGSRLGYIGPITYVSGNPYQGGTTVTNAGSVSSGTSFKQYSISASSNNSSYGSVSYKIGSDYGSSKSWTYVDASITLPSGAYTTSKYIYAKAAGSNYACLGISVGGSVKSVSATSTSNVFSYNFTSSTVPEGSVVAVFGMAVKLKFYANGGTGTMGDVSTYSVNYNGVSRTIPNCSFSYSGKSFAGWKINNSGDTYKSGTEVYTVATKAGVSAGGTINLYAQWSGYTVTYNANGGKVSPTSGSGTVTLPTPTASGYTCTGWKIGNTVYEVGAQYTPTGNVEAVAQWRGNKSTTKYDINGGTGTTPSSQSCVYGTSYYAAGSSGFSRTGYTFSKWTLNKDGTGTSVEAGGLIYWLTQKDNATVTLYAQWSPNTYTVKYSANGGSSTPSQQTCYYGTQYKAASSISRTGYTFKSWSKPGGGTISAGGSFSNLATSGTVTLTANWEENKYDVHFKKYANDTTDFSSITGCKYTETKNAPASAPTSDGCAFGGWKYGSTTLQAGESFSKLTPDNNGSVTFVAEWISNPITIKRNNGYGGSYSSINVQYDSVAEVPTPDRKDYKFVGWTVSEGLDSSVARWGVSSSDVSSKIQNDATLCYNSSGGQVYFKNIAKSGEVTITAHWERISYEIKVVDSNDDDFSESGSISVVSNDDAELLTSNSGKDVSFVALSGCTYKFVYTYGFLKKMSAGRISVVDSISASGRPERFMSFARDGSTQDGRAVFSCSMRFGENEGDSNHVFNVEYVVVNAEATLDPYSSETSSNDKTIEFADDTTRNVRITHGKRTGVSPLGWDSVDPDDTEVAVDPDTKAATVFVGINDVSIRAVYEMAVLNARVSVEQNALNAIGGEGSGDWVSCNAGPSYIGRASTECQFVYGSKVTFKLIKNSDRYAFAGWYSGSGTLLSKDTTYTTPVGNVTDVSVYARFFASVDISYRIVSDDASRVIGAMLTLDGESTSKSMITSTSLIGSSFSFSVSPTGVGVFRSWYNADNLFDPLPYSASDSYGTVTGDVSLVAVIADEALTHYVAIYPFYSDATSPEGEYDDGLCSVSMYASSYERIEKADFESGSKTKAKSDKGVFYRFVGSQNIRIGVSPKIASKPFYRIRESIVGGSSSTVVSRIEEVSRFITRNMEYVIDFGTVVLRRVSCVTIADASGIQHGALSISGGYSSFSESQNNPSADFERGELCRLSALSENGWKFAGWYSDHEGKNLVSDNPFYVFNVGDEDVVYYAKFARDSVALYKWEGGLTNKKASWKSKVYELSRPANLNSVRIDSTKYPVVSFSYGSFSSPSTDSKEPVRLANTVSVNSQTMRKLPSTRPNRFFSIGIVHDAEVDAITVGTSGEGLAQ